MLGGSLRVKYLLIDKIVYFVQLVLGSLIDKFRTCHFWRTQELLSEYASCHG